MSFLAPLARMNFFKRSGTYNVYSFGRVGYKNHVKTAKNIWEHMFLMQASDCVNNYLNRNKFVLSYLQSVISSCTRTSKNVIFICLGGLRF